MLQTGNSSGLTALVFPGQGSQREGMRAVVERHEPRLLELARQLVGSDPFERIAQSTRFQQPAIYCASIASWAAIGRPSADVLAGHSMGEVAALVAAGATDSETGLQLVVKRGQVTQQAASLPPASGMLAVMAKDPQELIDMALPEGVVVANDNSPTQVVLAGPLEQLARAKRVAIDSGLRAIRLPVEGAFHSPAMAPAIDAYAEVLAGIEFAAPHTPVYSGLTASEFTDPRTELASSLISPVRWRETVTALFERGVRRLVEPGPGDVVSKLTARQQPGIEIVEPVMS